MKKLLLALLPCLTLAQQTPISVGKLRQHITFLASDDLRGRGTGTDDERRAAAYIAEEFQLAGLLPKGDNGTYFQTFLTKTKNGNLTPPAGANNVVGYLDNGAKRTLVIGAHYDHLGMGLQDGSLEPNPQGKLHNGADDNASGVAGVLELARHFATNQIAEKHNLLFICFSGEELGLNGSRYFANNPTVGFETTDAMLNMDMIGRFEPAKGLTIGGLATSPVWNKIVADATTAAGMKFRADSAGTGGSDHTSFYVKNLPVLFFFTGVHTDYHKTSDDIDKINFEGEAKILGLVADIIKRTGEVNEKIQFRQYTDPHAATNVRMSFKVTMGLLLDYSFDGPGIKVDGVVASRPAQAAGIQAGDTVVKLGGYPLENVQGYMEALGKFEKGQTVDAQILRDGKLISKPVTF